MNVPCIRALLLASAYLVGQTVIPAEAKFPVEPHQWEPVADDVYLQEVGEQIKTTKPVTSVAAYKGNLFAAVEGNVTKLSGSSLGPVEGGPKKVSRMRALGGALWVTAEQGTYRFAGANWERVDSRVFTDFCVHLGEVCAATRDELFRFVDGHFVSMRPAEGYLSTDTTVMMEDGSQLLTDPVEIGPISRIASYSGTLYLLRGNQLGLIEGKTFVSNPIDWGALPSPRTRDMIALGSRLLVATERGVGVLRGMALTALRGQDGLPYEDTTCLAAGFKGDLWIGTCRGAIRKTGDKYHYFGAQHWLPGGRVNDITVSEQTVYVATDGGLGIIRYEPYTLAKKAQYFERELDERGMKRMGFVHKLYWGGEKEGWQREISDNDGGNTAHYLAAMSFKYAATGDKTARGEALEAFKAMVWLDDITPKPGFIARAIWSVKGDPGERSTSGSGGLPAKWYPSADGLWFWKGDTSSDEVNGHMFAVSVFHELAGEGKEKTRAARHIGNIARHIKDNGWMLRDMDGKPTRWGRWDPQYLMTPYGIDSRGLNGMEAQTYMQTAYALTGDAAFQEGLEQLLKWRYQNYTVRQRITFPPDQIAPWDDELAFFCYYPLLRYSKNPELRSIYLRSLERSYEILRMQQVPLFNFMYGGLTGNDCEAEAGVRHLRAWSLNLVNHSYENSHRSDLRPERDYVPYGGGTKAISPRESEAKWGSRSALQYDGGEGGRAVTPPIGWLEDYWMGRYFGMITAPTKELTLSKSMAPATGRKGAAPYQGTSRPEIKMD